MDAAAEAKQEHGADDKRLQTSENMISYSCSPNLPVSVDGHLHRLKPQNIVTFLRYLFVVSAAYTHSSIPESVITESCSSK